MGWLTIFYAALALVDVIERIITGAKKGQVKKKVVKTGLGVVLDDLQAEGVVKAEERADYDAGINVVIDRTVDFFNRRNWFRREHEEVY